MNSGNTLSVDNAMEMPLDEWYVYIRVTHHHSMRQEGCLFKEDHVGKTALLVGEDVREFSGVLGACGFEIVPYATAQKALARLRGRAPKPDLIICQSRTPIMRAFELFEKMREYWLSIPFVLASDRVSADTSYAHQYGITHIFNATFTSFAEVIEAAMNEHGQSVQAELSANLDRDRYDDAKEGEGGPERAQLQPAARRGR